MHIAQLHFGHVLRNKMCHFLSRHNSIVVDVVCVPDLVHDDPDALLSNLRLVGSSGFTVYEKTESVLEKNLSKNFGLDFGTTRDNTERAS